MTTAESYRKFAAELRTRATKKGDAVATELLNLALCYLRLAEQADRNNSVDIAVEFGPMPSLNSAA